MKTIKIIDLLNRIANGEEVPEKIIYRVNSYKYCEDIYDYKNENSFNEDYLFDRIDSGLKLNDEVEIIEDTPKENNKIEKVNTYVLCDTDFHSKGNFSLKATEIIDKAFEEYSNKINEIIDKGKW